MTRIQELILEALKHILLNGPLEHYLGICNSVDGYLANSHIVFCDDELDYELTHAIATWPHKSNSEAYPVGNWTDCPSELFWEHNDHRVSMWDPETRYGRARLDLLNHLIDYFQKLDAAS